MRDKKGPSIPARNQPTESTINVRLTAEERDLIERAANAYAKGNKSHWMRYAAIHFKPAEKDLKK